MSDAAFKGLIYLHADESCLGNQFRDRATPGGAAGLIEFFDRRRGWRRRDYYVSEPDTTNNRMALRSAIVGLEALSRPCRIAFYSDSNYLIRGAREEEISVTLDRTQLESLGLTAQSVAGAIAGADAKVRAGAIHGNAADLLIEVEGEIKAVDRLRAIPVRQGEDGQACHEKRPCDAQSFEVTDRRQFRT